MRTLSVVEVPAGGGFDSAQPPSETCCPSLVWTMIKRIFLITMIEKSRNQGNQVNQGSRQNQNMLYVQKKLYFWILLVSDLLVS